MNRFTAFILPVFFIFFSTLSAQVQLYVAKAGSPVVKGTSIVQTVHFPGEASFLLQATGSWANISSVSFDLVLP